MLGWFLDFIEINNELDKKHGSVVDLDEFMFWASLSFSLSLEVNIIIVEDAESIRLEMQKEITQCWRNVPFVQLSYVSNLLHSASWSLYMTSYRHMHTYIETWFVVMICT
jgi:hypothetical protein